MRILYICNVKRGIAVILSFLLLLSSSGLAYTQHFCGEYEMLAKITMGEQHLSCGMAMETASCDDATADHDCCDNHFTSVDLDDHFSKVSFNIAFDTQFVFAYVSVFLLEEPVVAQQKTIAYTTYRPPPLERDIQVWYEVFLI